MLKALYDGFLDFLFPAHCHICRSFIPEAGRVHICPSCLDKIKFINSPLCNICGIPFQGACNDHVCGACLSGRPHYDLARAAAFYEGGCRDLLHSFKYNYRTHLRRPLAILAAERLSYLLASIQPDMIVPVPLHVRRIRQRGFNQAILLGEVLAKEWGVPMKRRALFRVRWTEPQVNLSAVERRENVKGAFVVSNNAVVNDKRIMLIDDVLTTGSTVDECARVLKKAGAAEVVVVTVARAVL